MTCIGLVCCCRDTRRAIDISKSETCVVDGSTPHVINTCYDT